MLNFANIDYIEFEEICKQILEKKTGKTFRVFGRGQDGGIDIQANENEKIIGQAKFYLNTSQSDTVRAVKSEFNKIKNKKIEQYYIFIGREMSPQNIQNIYEYIKEIVKLKENIFTLKEINELLETEEYTEIVRKHVKLWLPSTNILEQINNRNIFLDCEVLFDNIKEDINLFIQTNVYQICQDILNKDRLLLILGMPGIGKTMLSKMLVLNYAQMGYSTRYSSSNDLEELKRAISLDKDKKELIFLDDCLGQRYLELHEQRENAIINLIKYIKKLPNKMLLLNSRVTIFQEAKNRQYELGKCIDNQNIQIQVVDIENISDLEKARIFKHYLVQKQLPEQYINEIVKNGNYLKIVKDTSYSPRIIDFMTEEKNYIHIKPQKYVESIQAAFKKSIYVWQDEYENRITPEDRIFLIILFSISNYAVNAEKLKLAFYERLKNENIDTSIPVFERVLERLNQSFVKIVIKDNERFVMAINPSVNDFMKKELENNLLEKRKILDSAIFIEQIQQYANSQKEYNELMIEKINKGEFLFLKTNTYNTIEEVYLAHIVHYNMLDKINEIDLISTVTTLKYGYNLGREYISKTKILTKILYANSLNDKQREKIFYNGKDLLKIMSAQSLEEQIQLLQHIYDKINGKELKNEDYLIKYLEIEFEDEPELYSISKFATECGLDNIVADEIEYLKEDYESDERWNGATEEDFKSDLIKRVKTAFLEVCSREVGEILDNLYRELPERIYKQMGYPLVGEWCFDEDEVNEVILKYINYVYKTPDEDYRYYRKYIYDGHLLNKKNDEESMIHSLFKK